MNNLYFAVDGSASAFASTQRYELGYVGVVRFAVDASHDGAVRHQCIRYRDTRNEALEDARTDAKKLVRMWVEDRVHIDDHERHDD